MDEKQESIEPISEAVARETEKRLAPFFAEEAARSAAEDEAILHGTSLDAEVVKIEHVETPPLPQQTGPVEIVACPAELAGKPCSICSDEPNTKSLVEGEKIATVPTDQGVLVQHALCHFAVRCLNLESLLAQYVHALEDAQKGQRATHQTLCAVIAKTGRVRLYQSNFERAMAAAYKLDIVSNEADQSTMISLKGAAHIQVVRELPKG